MIFLIECALFAQLFTFFTSILLRMQIKFVGIVVFARLVSPDKLPLLLWYDSIGRFVTSALDWVLADL